MIIPGWFRGAFWLFALLASVFYALKAFEVFEVKTQKKPCGWWVHQVWFNFAGSLVGWVATWFVVLKAWPCLAADRPADLSWPDAALVAVAFVGITGHLPFATAGLLQGINELAQKVAGLEKKGKLD